MTRVPGRCRAHPRGGAVHADDRAASRGAGGDHHPPGRQGRGPGGARAAADVAPRASALASRADRPGGGPGRQVRSTVECEVVAPENTTVDVTATIDLPPPLTPLGPARGVSRAGPPPGEP
ncbi:hypothetical protein QJS66_18740 [Kocuria rhizophila]|nr:hypothetical protein QJS66_18740 [Kocuria rhizophila]